jgi:hypothetical protein
VALKESCFFFVHGKMPVSFLNHQMGSLVFTNNRCKVGDSVPSEAFVGARCADINVSIFSKFVALCHK